MNTVLDWAAVASPIIGAIAIVVALIIGHRSSKDAKKQIASICNLMEVFIASQNLTIMDAKRQYEKQLHELNLKIKDAVEREQQIALSLFDPTNILSLGMIIDMKKIDKQQKKINKLLKEKKEVEENLNLIQSYFDKSASQKP